MRPELFPVAGFIQLGNAHTVLVGWDVLGGYVHGDLRQIQVGANASRGGNPYVFQNVPHHGHGQLVGGHVVVGEVGGCVDEHLVHRI